MSNKYLSISSKSEGLFKDRGSKFIAYLFPCSNETEFESELKILKKLHPKSRHFCYAYRFLERERMNDDGEPSGTAGKPIMGQIKKADLKDVGVIVIRYFGGTLLGTGGLIQAYKAATALAIDAVEIIQKEILSEVHLNFDYQHLSPIMLSIKKHKLRIKSQELGESGNIILSVAPDEVESTIRFLKADVGQLYIEEVNEETSIAGLCIKNLPSAV